MSVTFPPDADDARDLLADELAKPEYSTELTPLTRFIRSILQAIFDAADGGTWDPPLGLILLAVFVVALVVLLVAVFLQRGLFRRTRSAKVFADDGRDVVAVKEELERARAAGQWNEAFIWAFRLMVLTAAERQLLRDGPGLTAREAAAQMSRRLPAFAPHVEGASTTFDDVRYGETPATASDVDAIMRIVGALSQVGARS